jgi:hypothetical protein
MTADPRSSATDLRPAISARSQGPGQVCRVQNVRRVLGIVIFVAIASGCGGTRWNDAQSSSTSGPPSSAAGASDTEREYIDAMVQSALANPHMSAGVPAQTLRCVATAIVHAYGTSAFAEAGLTPAVLRDPNSTLAPLPQPSGHQGALIGRAAQQCGAGALIADAFVTEFHVADPTQRTCLSKHLERDVDAQRFVVSEVMDRTPDLAAANGVATILGRCIDLAIVALDASRVPFTSAEKACIATSIRSSAALFRDLLAQSIAGHTPTSAQYQQLLNPAIAECLTPARRLQLRTGA